MDLQFSYRKPLSCDTNKSRPFSYSFQKSHLVLPMEPSVVFRKTFQTWLQLTTKWYFACPGRHFLKKCAWAARINRDNVIAVTSGVNPKCTSSKGLKGSDKSIFDPMNQMVCVGTAGERELFFVGGIMLRIN